MPNRAIYKLLKKGDREYIEDLIQGEVNGVKFRTCDLKLEERRVHHNSNGGTTVTYVPYFIGRFFEFGVDVNDQTYIEFVDYWENFNCHKFKIFFILSSGERGQVYANSLTKVTGGVWSRTGTGNQQRVYNVNNFIKLTHFDSTYGYYPETPNEARKNAVAFQNTIDTLITLADFERACLRHELTANVRATD